MHVYSFVLITIVYDIRKFPINKCNSHIIIKYKVQNNIIYGHHKSVNKHILRMRYEFTILWYIF